MENNRYREEELEEKENKIDNEESLIKEKEDNQDSKTDSLDKKNKEQKDKNKINKLKKKIAHLEKELNEKDEEIKNIQNEMLKDRAELENFKKRTNDERMKERKYANQYLIEDLLDMIDILDHAVNGEVDDEKLAKYLMGFKMISGQIQDILGKYGLAKIECLNKKFDPTYHEAIGFLEIGDSELEEDTIVEVVRNGYMYKDRVIRPSKVKVIKHHHDEN